MANVSIRLCLQRDYDFSLSDKTFFLVEKMWLNSLFSWLNSFFGSTCGSTKKR